jgi:serine/threonine protein phosphatase PrpC
MMHPPAPELSYAVRSDVGMLRLVNEDAALAAAPCFLVADGMGGHEAGEVASAAAVGAFADRIAADRPATLGLVSAALDDARNAVAQVAFGRARGAGCTLTGVVLVECEGELAWFVLNIGDSRVYLHRGGELRQLTIDHSLRDEVIAEGLTAEDRLPGRNIITRALGSADTLADSWLLPVEAGARLLICSDGLTTELHDEQLRATLDSCVQPEAAVEELVSRANDAGGRDNITAIVVDVVSLGAVEACPAGSVSDLSETNEGSDDGGVGGVGALVHDAQLNDTLPITQPHVRPAQ